MNIEFSAKFVSYSEAMDGEIIQVIFEEEEESDPLSPKYKSLCISISYEFSPRQLDVQWSDAEELGGGKIQKYQLNKSELNLALEGGDTITVRFNTDTSTLANISELLAREVDGKNMA